MEERASLDGKETNSSHGDWSSAPTFRVVVVRVTATGGGSFAKRAA